MTEDEGPTNFLPLKWAGAKARTAADRRGRNSMTEDNGSINSLPP
jgi:hypothetical protein